jgi:hypothetical protein
VQRADRHLITAPAGASCSLSDVASVWEPPTNRSCCAPPSVAISASIPPAEWTSPGVAPHLRAGLDQVLAVAEGGERRDAELGRQRREPVLGRADPRAARLEHLAIADLLVERAAADPVARLEHHHAPAGAGEVARRDQARQPGADDDYVDFINTAYDRSMPQHEPDNRKRELKTESGQKFKVKLPPGMEIEPLGATTEAKPKPAPADDPRPAFHKNVGGPYAY